MYCLYLTNKAMSDKNNDVKNSAAYTATITVSFRSCYVCSPEYISASLMYTWHSTTELDTLCANGYHIFITVLSE